MAGADQPVRKVTIVGGGTAGSAAAAVLSQWLTKVEIKLVESDEIGIVGVAEATIPQIRNLLSLGGIDPLEMIAKSNPAFFGKQFLGIVKSFVSDENLASFVSDVAEVIEDVAETMPDHGEFVRSLPPSTTVASTPAEQPSVAFTLKYERGGGVT